MIRIWFIVLVSFLLLSKHMSHLSDIFSSFKDLLSLLQRQPNGLSQISEVIFG